MPDLHAACRACHAKLELCREGSQAGQGAVARRNARARDQSAAAVASAWPRRGQACASSATAASNCSRRPARPLASAGKSAIRRRSSVSAVWTCARGIANVTRRHACSTATAAQRKQGCDAQATSQAKSNRAVRGSEERRAYLAEPAQAPHARLVRLRPVWAQRRARVGVAQCRPGVATPAAVEVANGPRGVGVRIPGSSFQKQVEQDERGVPFALKNAPARTPPRH